MTITGMNARVAQALARHIPHDDALRVQVTMPGSGEDEYGNPVEGTVTLSEALPCTAQRLSDEDAVKGGFDSTRELWRIVTNATSPRVSATETVTVTRSGGQALTLSVQSVTGTERQVITGEVVG